MLNEPLFNSIYINEFRPGSTMEQIDDKVVYHYTEANALLSILKNKSVWFSDIRYMNDRSETMFIVKCLVEFSEDKGDKFPFFRDALNELLAENDKNQIINLNADRIKYSSFFGLKMEARRTFIFCTSTEADSLNMWNYYASNGTYTGYNIGLSVKDFLKTFDVDGIHESDNFNVLYGNVLYEKKKQFEAIEDLACKIEKFSSYGTSKQYKACAATHIRQYIVFNGPFFKDESFKSEKEYRFLFSIAENKIPRNKDDSKTYFGQYNQKLCEGFCVRKGIIVPYMQVAIPENAISGITLSPIIEYEIAKSSIKELLKSEGILSKSKNEVPIYKSRIPIRF